MIVDEYDLPEKVMLSSAAQRSLRINNAGGKSEVSEAFSIDYFQRIFQAREIILEMEVEYWIDYSMVDYICTVGHSNGHRIGVSVTRAMGYPNETFFTEKDASYLLQKKLSGLIISRNAVSEKHSFFRSILHVWCQNQRIANLLREEFGRYDLNDFGLDIQGTIILLLTICPLNDIYTNTRHNLICS